MSARCSDGRCGADDCEKCHPELQLTSPCCECGAHVERFRLSGLTCHICGGEVCVDCVESLWVTDIGMVCDTCADDMNGRDDG